MIVQYIRHKKRRGGDLSAHIHIRAEGEAPAERRRENKMPNSHWQKVVKCFHWCGTEIQFVVSIKLFPFRQYSSKSIVHKSAHKFAPNVFLWPPEHPLSCISVNLSWEWMCWVRPLLDPHSYREENHRHPTARRHNEHSSENKLVLWGVLMPPFCYPVRWGRHNKILHHLRWRLVLQKPVFVCV